MTVRVLHHLLFWNNLEQRLLDSHTVTTALHARQFLSGLAKGELLRVHEGSILRLVLAHDLRQLRVVELVSLIVWSDDFIPPLAHLLDRDGSELQD